MTQSGSKYWELFEWPAREGQRPLTYCDTYDEAQDKIPELEELHPEMKGFRIVPPDSEG